MKSYAYYTLSLQLIISSSALGSLIVSATRRMATVFNHLNDSERRISSTPEYRLNQSLLNKQNEKVTEVIQRFLFQHRLLNLQSLSFVIQSTQAEQLFDELQELTLRGNLPPNSMYYADNVLKILFVFSKNNKNNIKSCI